MRRTGVFPEGLCRRTGWMVHAWGMGNQNHLFIETPEANLVEGDEMVTEHLYEAQGFLTFGMLHRSLYR